jgi:hypothetical protein
MKGIEPKEKTMKALIAGVTLAALYVTPTLADFYIVQEPTTKRCRIVEERPAGGAAVVIGTPFGARVEAERQMRTVEVCRETTGSGGDVTIEERRPAR